VHKSAAKSMVLVLWVNGKGLEIPGLGAGTGPNVVEVVVGTFDYGFLGGIGGVVGPDKRGEGGVKAE
jgi:hypothetical protein